MPEVAYDTILVQSIDDGAITRIVLNRPEKRNAQNSRMLYELHDAFMAAAVDDEVKVIILGAEGPMFSSGHDTRDAGSDYHHDPVFPYSNTLPGAQGGMNREFEIYFNWCRRIHDIPKPTIAEVHGKVIAGGLMLMWVCDLIVAADDSEFIDITAAPPFMVQGVEWFSHPWEFGHRKAKEMLYTGEAITAEDAYRLGMINRLTTRERLQEETLALARKIAARASFGHQLAKMAVNQALDAQGFWTAQQASFNLQHLGHSHAHILWLLEQQQAQAAEAASAAAATPSAG
jgi:enoyl-CoA hydratase